MYDFSNINSTSIDGLTKQALKYLTGQALILIPYYKVSENL